MQTLGTALMPGDPCPHFAQRTQTHPAFHVDSMAGRYLVLCFYGSAADPAGRGAIEAVLRHRDRFDDHRASFFGVAADPADEAERRVPDAMPGVRFLFDFDRKVSRLCGALPPIPNDGPEVYRRFWLIIDPTLHVLARFAFSSDDPDHRAVFARLDSLPDPDQFAGFELPPPVLVLPNVFEAVLCRRLIEAYETDGGHETGVMRGGAGVHDHAFKRRKDYVLTDPELITATRRRIIRRILPEIRRLFSAEMTYIERYIVGCYAAEDGGHFRPHRDNNSDITAHRRFAVSVNLSGDFEGGDLWFPEYGQHGYKAPPGWAIVFPGNILHAVHKVTSGRRYAFLPFVYDEAGARIRQENNARLRPAAPEGAGAVTEDA